MIASKEAFTKLVLAEIPGLNTAQLLRLLATGVTSRITFNAHQMPSGVVRLLWHEGVLGTTRLLLSMLKMLLNGSNEVGSDIQEADRFIKSQTRVLTISENTGYAKIFNRQQILDITPKA